MTDDEIAQQIAALRRAPAAPNVSALQAAPNGAPPLDTGTPVLEPDGTPASLGSSSSPAAPAPRMPEVSPAEQEDDRIAQQIGAQRRDENRRQAQMLRWRDANGEETPERTRDILLYSSALKLSPDLVAQDLEGARKQAEAAHVDWDEVATRQPMLKQWLLDRPEVQPLVKDDVANLKGIEWAMRAPFHAFWDAAMEEVFVRPKQAFEAVGLGGEENRKAIAKGEALYANKDYGAESAVAKGVLGAARMAPQFFLDKLARFAVGAIGAKFGAEAGAVAGAAAGAPAAGVGAAPGAAVGAAAGGIVAGGLSQFVASGLFNAYETLGPEYWKLSQLRDANGYPMDPAVARAMAGGAAIANGALISLFFGAIGGKVPALQKVLGKVGLDAAGKMMANPTTAGAVARFGVKWGENVAHGAVFMAAQSAANQAAEEGAKALAAGPTDRFDAHWGNVGTAMAQGFKQGIEDLWLFGGIEPATHLPTDLTVSHALRSTLEEIGQARRSAESAARLEGLNALAGESKLLERSPDALEELLGRMKDSDEGVDTVYVPIEAWTKYHQEQKTDPGQVAAEILGDGGAAFAEASSTKGDLAIPVEKYFARLSQEQREGLAQDSKLSPDVRTPKQQAQVDEQLLERMRADSKDRKTELDAGEQRVHDAFHEQILGAGRSKTEADAIAKKVAAFARTMALRLNVSIEQAAQLSRLGDFRILGQKGPAIADAANRRLREFIDSPSGSKELKTRLPQLETSHRGEELYRDENTGLLGEDAFGDLPADPSKPKVAAIAVEGIKYLNDTGSHGHADLLYRAAARALHQVDPLAAKVGGDFAIRVKDQAELDQVLERARAQLPEQLRNAFELTGALGENYEAAGKAMGAENDRRVAAGERANSRPLDPSDPTGEATLVPEKPLGLARLGLEGKDLVLPDGRAQAELPPELVRKIEDMSDKAYFERAYLDRAADGTLTGLLNARGWNGIRRKKHQAMLDLRDLKKKNKLGREVGDEFLKQFSSALNHFGGSSFDAAHLHGDEYALQHDDPEQLRRMVAKLEEVAHTYIAVPYTHEGKTVRLRGARFWHGIGQGLEAADHALNERKLAFKAKERLARSAGRDDVRGDGPLPGEAPRDQAQGGGDHDRGRVDLEGGRAALGRGAQPQGFPGAREARTSPPSGGSSSSSGGGGQRVAYVEGRPVTFEPDTSFEFGSTAEPAVLKVPDETRAEVEALISRMKDPAKRELASAWLAFTQGESTERPIVTAELEKQLARYGVVDPAGYSYDEFGRDLSGPTPGGRRRKSEEPAHLRELRLERLQRRDEAIRGGFTPGTGVYDQAALSKLHQEPPGGGAPRGTISFQVDPSGRPRAFDVQVLKGDRSTLAHETAHFLGWSLHDVATSDLATPKVREDYAKLLKWAGFDSPEQRLAENTERTNLGHLVDAGEASPEEVKRLKKLTAKEERISHGWEQFLAEGKAPAPELRSVFSRFKGWMLRIYKGVGGIQEHFRQQYGEELGLSDEVRDVFNRLLTAEDAVQRAHEETQLKPFEGAMAGMTDAERTEYRAALDRAAAGADEHTNQRAAELLDGDKLEEERARIAEEVTREFDAQPVFRAQRFLQRGELVDAEGKVLTGADLPDLLLRDGQPLKLNREKFREQFGLEAEKEMPPGIFDPTKKGGTGPEDLAPLLGFESAKDLVQTFARTPARERAISDQVQVRMDEAYGPARKAIEDAALSAVHSDAALRATLLELRAMARQISPDAERLVHVVDMPTLKATAARVVSETSVGALDPLRYQRAERKAALERERLWGEGKKPEAVTQAEARVLNAALYRVARDTRDELASARDRIESTDDKLRARLGKADVSYRDTYDAIAEAVGLVKLQPREAIAQRVGLDAALARAQADAQEMDFDVDGVRKLLADPKHWDSLTVEEARNVDAALENLRTAARRRNEVLINGKRQSVDSFFHDLTGAIARAREKVLRPYSKTARNKDVRAVLGHLGRGLDALLSDTETLANLIDGGDRNGPAHRLLVDGRLEARARATKLEQQVLEPIQKLWENIPKELQKLASERVDVAEILPLPPAAENRGLTATFTRDQLWSLYLNWGNDGNRQRIRDGNGWSDAQVEKALSLLSKPELDFLQGVLDTIDSLYPELARVYRGRTGLELPKVAAVPITLNGETRRGGYFPLRYDSEISRQGGKQKANFAADSIQSLFPPGYHTPAVGSSHTKGRVEKVKAAVDLSWNVVPAHLSQVIHDVTYGDWVRQSARLMLDERWQNLMTDFLGAERAKNFLPWLADVAAARSDSSAAATSDLLRESGWIRSKLSAAVLAYNIPNMAANFTDPFLNADVKVRHVASAYLKVLAGSSRAPFERSEELAYRDLHFGGNIRKTLGEYTQKKGAMARATEVGFHLYEMIDHFTTRVLFHAAHEQAKSEGLDDAAAVKFADDQVRRTFTSHDVAEKPPILRTHQGMASALMFYGFANKQFNLARSAAVGGPARMAAQMLRTAIVGGIASAFLAGRGPKEDESWAGWAATRMLLENFNSLPWVGGVIEKAVQGEVVDIRTVPELAVVEDLANHFIRLTKKWADGEASSDDRLWAAIDLILGVVPGGGQIRKTGGYVRKLNLGEVQPRPGLPGAFDAAGGLIYGERKERRANPLTLAGDAAKKLGL